VSISVKYAAQTLPISVILQRSSNFSVVPNSKTAMSSPRSDTSHLSQTDQ